MLNAVAFCPMAPVLIPEVAGGAAPELDGLRAACRDAIVRAAGPGRRWTVLGPGPASRPFAPTSRGTFAGVGVPLELGLGADEPGPLELPLSLTVGAWLLRDALGPGCGAVGWSVDDAFDTVLNHWDDGIRDDGIRDDGIRDDDSEHAVLVMGDGSARRSVKAPGYFDERAEAADARVAEALRQGAGHRLHQQLIDEDDELLIGGRSVWELVSWSVEAVSWDAELLYDAAPYGVGYFVASWQLDESGLSRG